MFNDDEVKVIPGAVGTVPFIVKDEFNKSVHPLMHLGLSVRPHETTTGVTPSYSINNNKFWPTGKPHSTTTLNFVANGVSGVFFRFNVTLLDCPPGFYFNDDLESTSCVCSTNSALYAAIVRCDSTQYKALMTRDYWAGSIHPLKFNEPQGLILCSLFHMQGQQPQIHCSAKHLG